MFPLRKKKDKYSLEQTYNTEENDEFLGKLLLCDSILNCFVAGAHEIGNRKAEASHALFVTLFE